jgi:glutamate--cysteine ligase
MTVLNAASDAASHAEPLTLDAAYALSHAAALRDSAIGAVGLELENHTVDLSQVCAAVPWERVGPMPGMVSKAAGRSAVTLEPGGQIELSGPPGAGIEAAVDEMSADIRRTREALADFGLGIALAGMDPLRPSRRVNPRPRYQAMETHYAAIGRGETGRVMMASTAALQVNLDAGPKAGWARRVARAYRIGPTMIAISASSPWLHGQDTGWKSARQRSWNGMEPRACGPVPGCLAGKPGGDDALDPAAAYARFALRAPVVFVRTSGADVTPIRSWVSFEQWVSGAARLGGRVPTTADLDEHLTTLFPPVRLRGFMELRYLDMSAPRWWPAIAAVVTTLMDDPVAADLATEATEPASALWTTAARTGLGDATLAASARRCLRIAADRVPVGLAQSVADLAELVESGRCPGDLLAERITEIGPHAAFEELARA